MLPPDAPIHTIKPPGVWIEAHGTPSTAFLCGLRYHEAPWAALRCGFRHPEATWAAQGANQRCLVATWAASAPGRLKSSNLSDYKGGLVCSGVQNLVQCVTPFAPSVAARRELKKTRLVAEKFQSHNPNPLSTMRLPDSSLDAESRADFRSGLKTSQNGL